MGFVADTFDLGSAAITRVTETDLVFSHEMFMRRPTSELEPYLDWLRPYLTDDLQHRMIVQTMLVAVDGLRIVVDTCIGNGKDFGAATPMFNGIDTPFLERITAAGFAPDLVDLVVCTHLHVDHVGWNTHLVDDEWIPTFPNARYLFAVADVDHWAANPSTHNPFASSVQPVLDAGLADLVVPPHRVSPSVTLVPTPGHSPGHLSVRIDASGGRVVITGDMVHSPVQFARPDWSSVADTDPEQAEATRRALLAEVADTDTWVLGTHFAPPTAGRIARDGDGWRFA